MAVKQLIVALGPHACAFITANLQPAQLVPLASILLPEETFSDCNLASDESGLSHPGATLSRIDAGTMLLRQPRALPNLESGRAFDWAEAVSSLVQPSRVVMLDTLLVSDMAEKKSSQPLYVVRTSTHPHRPHVHTTDRPHTDTATTVSSLEMPNVVAGASAELLSMFEAQGVAAQLFLAPLDPHAPAATVQAFHLARLPINAAAEKEAGDRYATCLQAAQVQHSAANGLRHTVPIGYL